MIAEQKHMPAQTVSRSEIEDVITRNLKYPEYRALFLKSPKTMIEDFIAHDRDVLVPSMS